MSYLERILADKTLDEAAWAAARANVIGASDAADFARFESADRYTLAKLKAGSFRGNEFTRAGHIWEARMLDWAGIAPSGLLVHAADEPGFAATPDGIEVLPSGEIVLVECKAIHGRRLIRPGISFLRQMWWAQAVFGPEVRRTKFIWQEVVDGAPMRLEPHILIVDRDEDAITELHRIGREVLHRLRAAREFQEELAA